MLYAAITIKRGSEKAGMGNGVWHSDIVETDCKGGRVVM